VRPGEGEGEREEGQDNLENGDAAVGAGAARTDAAAVTAGGHRRGESGELARASGRKSSGEGAMGSAALWTWGWVRRTRVRDAGKVVAQGTAAWGAVGCACLVTGGCGAAACWSWSEASHCHVACLFFQWIFLCAQQTAKRNGKSVTYCPDPIGRLGCSDAVYVFPTNSASGHADRRLTSREMKITHV